MRITLMTHGTRGDVQPMIALAVELEQRGHSTRLAVPVNTSDQARKVGLEVFDLPLDSQQFLASPDVREALASGNSRHLLDKMRSATSEHSTETTQVLHAAITDTNLIVAGPMVEDRATVLAEALRVPLVLLHTFPMRRTSVAANPMVSGRSSRIPGFNALTHVLYERSTWKARSEGINKLRSFYGLAPTDLTTQQRAQSLGAVELQTYSPNVISDPNWPTTRPTVGWLRLTEESRQSIAEFGISDDLRHWINDGEPPAYFGFGSMPIADPAEAVAMIERVTTSLGVRAIVNTGWGGLTNGSINDSSRLRIVDAIDHDTLLPHCSIAVHHGGSGTTGASIRAGLPTMICSVLFDQRLWGQRLERLGVGAHVRFTELTASTLQAGLTRLFDSTVQSKATALGQKVRNEPDAASVAADHIATIAVSTA